MSLTREQILGIKDLKIEPIFVPEWNDTVYVRSMTGAERDAFEASIYEFNQSTGKSKLKLEFMRARLCSFTICDQEGNRLFTDEDVQALAAKNSTALLRIVSLAQRLSAVTDEDLQELEKN